MTLLNLLVAVLLRALAAGESGRDDGDVSGSVFVCAQFLQRIRNGYAIPDSYFQISKTPVQTPLGVGYWRKDQIVLVPDVGYLRQQRL